MNQHPFPASSEIAQPATPQASPIQLDYSYNERNAALNTVMNLPVAQQTTALQNFITEETELLLRISPQILRSQPLDRANTRLHTLQNSRLSSQSGIAFFPHNTQAVNKPESNITKQLRSLNL